MKHNPQNSAVLLLAAGGSRRLGKAKQTLIHQSKPLINLAVEQALSLDIGVYVVIGARKDSITPLIENYPVNILFNENWDAGIGTSISLAMSQIDKQTDSVLFMLCDQPFVPTNHYRKIVNISASAPSKIVATNYPNERKGVPAVFPKFYFDELKNLSKDQGAQSIIKLAADTVIGITCPEAELDIDTPDQVRELLSPIPIDD